MIKSLRFPQINGHVVDNTNWEIVQTTNTAISRVKGHHLG